MEKEYNLSVCTSPHTHDNRDKPYFWCIIERCGGAGANSGSGWAATPERAFADGMEYLRKMKERGMA